MELTGSIRTLLIETAKALQGSDRRLFRARTVKGLGAGGQQCAARELGWGRMTIRKGMRELDSGLICQDSFCLRGRKQAKQHLPNLLVDIQAIADASESNQPAVSHGAVVHPFDVCSATTPPYHAEGRH